MLTSYCLYFIVANALVPCDESFKNYHEFCNIHDESFKHIVCFRVGTVIFYSNFILAIFQMSCKKSDHPYQFMDGDDGSEKVRFVDFTRAEGFLFVKDGRQEQAKKHVYIGNFKLFGGLENDDVFLKFYDETAADIVLVSDQDIGELGRHIVKHVEDGKSDSVSKFIILDVGYNLIEQLATTAIVAFAEHVSAYADVLGHKLVLASMTVVPYLQGLQEKMLEVNKAFNEINIKNGFTPHYGVRSVMKYHKASGSYKIRPSLWLEWNKNVGFGQEMTQKAQIAYLSYQKGYFLKGFGGTEKAGDINTRVKKDQQIQVKDRKEFDARKILEQRQKIAVWNENNPGSDPEYEDLKKFVMLLLESLDRVEKKKGGVAGGSKRQMEEQSGARETKKRK